MVGPTSPNGSSTAEVVSAPQQSGNSRLPREKHSAACGEAHERKIVGRALKRSGEIDGMASWWRQSPTPTRRFGIPPLFQAGWFVESVLTQTLIIHIIRTTKIPFIESRASSALVVTTVIICAVGMSLPFTWAGAALGFAPLPRLYWPLVAVMLVTYATLTHVMNVWFTRRVGL